MILCTINRLGLERNKAKFWLLHNLTRKGNPKFICVTRHMLHDGVGDRQCEFGPSVTILRYANSDHSYTVDNCFLLGLRSFKLVVFTLQCREQEQSYF